MQTEPMTRGGRITRCSGPISCGLALGVLLLCCLLAASIAAADGLPQPQGPAILTVTGSVERTNSGEGAVFDREMLADLGMESLETTTAWDEGTVLFEGVLLRRLLDAVGAKGDTIHATALNAYHVDIPFDDVKAYDVILAMKMNGAALSLRDKGPLWIVYPLTDHPELDTPEFNSRWIWQLQSLEIQ